MLPSLFASLKFARLHNHSPLLTMMGCIRNCLKNLLKDILKTFQQAGTLSFDKIIKKHIRNTTKGHQSFQPSSDERAYSQKPRDSHGNTKRQTYFDKFGCATKKMDFYLLN
ncbi:hypothetical protein OS493_015462 [Desmophyllum pertusum]|uniref:Uncharacterized protein n=1 Tax=Desmophyllum pertusum TaxID=174260 RepID=A0A9W9Z0M8_9CNID|nr:hypothetical protein OS493_015462 [Desmophyllum pertusum]